MLSRQLEVSLRLAVSMARQKRHEFLTVEHLLLALLDNDSAVNALKACGADVVTLRKELEEYVEQHTPKLGENSEQAPHPTESFDRILQRAIFHVQSSGGDRTVEGADVLVAMYSERDTFAVYLLKRHQINRLTLTQYLSHGYCARASACGTSETKADVFFTSSPRNQLKRLTSDTEPFK